MTKNTQEAIMLLWAEIKELTREIGQIRNYKDYQVEERIDRIEYELEELFRGRRNKPKNRRY